MACKTVTLPPFKATLQERNPSSFAESLIRVTVPGAYNITSSERKYEPVINQCTGDVTVFEVKSNGQKVPKITSLKKDGYVVKVVDKSESPIIQKSLIEDVYKKGNIKKLQRAEVQKLPDEEIIANGLLMFKQPEEEDMSNYAIDADKIPVGQAEGVPANIVDKDFISFPAFLSYPETLEKNEFKQDFIQFKVIQYQPRIFTTDGLRRLERFEKVDKEKLIKSTIRLPIQGGISDTNLVNWNSDQMNSVEQAAGFASLTLGTNDIKESFDEIKGSIESLLKDQKSNTAISSYLHALFAKMAVGSSGNFFSRAFGALLNPNLELLFQNVELRPFSFRFDLTPRNDKEAKQVRQIIRVFKQSMAARKGVAEIFLKTPMVYELEYINGNNGKKHKAIGRIKTCALRNFTVNYTPTNQYMTYDDNANTMTAYSLDMQFQELEPIYFDDYQKIEMDEIGF